MGTTIIDTPDLRGARIVRLFLADRPYADEARAVRTMSHTRDAAGFVLAAALAECQAMYGDRFSHWWLLGQSGLPGDLESLRRWKIAEGECPSDLPLFRGDPWVPRGRRRCLTPPTAPPMP